MTGDTPQKPAERAEERLSAPDRQRAIIDMVMDRHYVDIASLSRHFGVTVQTIRRDLNQLGAAGLLHRHHGGAAAKELSVENIGYADRQVINRPEKLRIAQAAAALIPDNASLFVNIGTTTEAVADALVHHRNLRIVTNNLNVAMRLSRATSFEIIIAGGVIRNADGGVVGETTAEFFEQFRVDFGIIGISAIDPVDGSLLDYDYREVRVSQAILRNAKRVVLVADHSKFERDAMVRLGSIRQVHMLCTDRPPPPNIAALLQEAGAELIMAPRTGG